MSFVDFVLNGGIMGAIRGFDHNKEQRPYGWSELEEDVKSGVNSVKPLAEINSTNILPQR